MEYSGLAASSKRTLGWTALTLFGLLCLADYHYSLVNQLPSDGPLTIGYPLTLYWRVCPMISGGAACRGGMSAWGLIVDLIACGGFAMIAAAVAVRFFHSSFIRRKSFWLASGACFVLVFISASVISAWRSIGHRGRSIEIGFPVTYLREYAGESWSLVNLAADVSLSLIVSLLIAAVFFKQKSAKVHLKHIS